MRKLPPLNALPAFEATARLGSVVLAAEELGRTHGAVSKQLRNLSAALGVELFQKAGTGLRLTVVGEALLPRVASALDIIDEASEAARRSATGEVLTLGISATFATRWLMPRLPRFHNAHPGIKIEFLMAGRMMMDVSQYDVVVTWDRLRFHPEPGEPYEPLGDVAFGLVHAPGYPVRVSGQAAHVELRLVPDTAPKQWETWGALSGITVTSEREQVVPNTGLLVNAATAGLGAAILERRLIEEELDDERLVAPFGFTVIEGGFGAFISGRGAAKPAARQFVEWLRGEA